MNAIYKLTSHLLVKLAVGSGGRVYLFFSGCYPKSSSSFTLGTRFILNYINDLCNNFSNALYHFYAGDTIIYC